MQPRKALVLATLCEFIGPLAVGTAVARTMAVSILRPDILEHLTLERIYLMVIGAVGAAIAWSIATWVLRLPSSSSHALIGGLIGAGVVLLGKSAVPIDKLLTNVVLPLFASPLIGIIIGSLVFSLIRQLFSRAHRRIGLIFVTLQKPCMLFLAASHGANDAQKSMGVIALLLMADCPNAVGVDVPQWVVVSCAAAMALGLTIGGRRIAKVVGYGICRVEPVHSFASQVTTASVVLAASIGGGPVSTAQVMASSVMGVGAARRLSGVKWSAAGSIIYAWLLTIPMSAALGAGTCLFLVKVCHA